MLYTCKSRSKHSSSKCKLHTLIFSSDNNFSRRNFCFHAIFNASSRDSQYKLIFSFLEALELLSQPTAAHITIVKIIYKILYKTIFAKLYFKENWKYFALAEDDAFYTQLIWIWLTKDRVIKFSVAPVTSEKKGKTFRVNWTFATQNSKERKEKYLQY